MSSGGRERCIGNEWVNSSNDAKLVAISKPYIPLKFEIYFNQKLVVKVR